MCRFWITQDPPEKRRNTVVESSIAFNVGDFVSFESPDGDVLGKVVQTEYKPGEIRGEWVTVKVTSRTKKYYPKGLRYRFIPSALKLRKAA
jgi:hypothetical protein